MSEHHFNTAHTLGIRDHGGYCHFTFHCPGCGRTHWIRVGPPHGWTFDGNEESPTFAPSILVRGVLDTDPGPPPIPFVCHSFIRAGMIEFLSDCTHKLAGQTVPMVPIP